MDIVLDRVVERTETNIDNDKINTVKKNIVAYKTRINGIFNDMELSASSIKSSFDGTGSIEFDKAYKKIAESNNNVLYNIDLHIDELNRACVLFQHQDIDVGQSINTNIS